MPADIFEFHHRKRPQSESRRSVLSASSVYRAPCDRLEPRRHGELGLDDNSKVVIEEGFADKHGHAFETHVGSWRPPGPHSSETRAAPAIRGTPNSPHGEARLERRSRDGGARGITGGARRAARRSRRGPRGPHGHLLSGLFWLATEVAGSGPEPPTGADLTACLGQDAAACPKDLARKISLKDLAESSASNRSPGGGRGRGRRGKDGQPETNSE